MNTGILMETDEIMLCPLDQREVGEAEIGRAAAAYGGMPGCFGVLAKESGDLVGFVLCPEEEISIYISPDHREQRYGAAALALSLDLIFGDLGRSRVAAICPRHNIAAVKTLLCCGFEEEKTGAEENRDFRATLTIANWELL